MKRVSKLKMGKPKAVFVEDCFFLFLKTVSARRPQKLIFKSHTSVIRDVKKGFQHWPALSNFQVRVFALSQARVPAN